jgi:hypothetical protein
MAKRRKVILQLMETTADTESAGGYIKEGTMRTMRFVVLALATFLLASAWAVPKMSGDKQIVKERKVTIAVETAGKTGGLILTPHVLVTRKMDAETIVWACPGYQIFTLDFGWASPFSEISHPAYNGNVRLNITSDLPEGHFPYFVAVYDAKNQRIITSDPDLIIRK